MKTKDFIKWLKENEISHTINSRSIDTPFGWVRTDEHAVMGIDNPDGLVFRHAFGYHDLKTLEKMVKYAMTPVKKRGTL